MFKKKPKPEAAADVPATTEGAEGEAPAKKKLPLKLLIIAGAGAVVVLGGGAAAAMLLLGGGGGSEAHAEEGGEAAEEPPAVAASGGGESGSGSGSGAFGTVTAGPNGVSYYNMPNMLADIQSQEGRPLHLALTLTFEVRTQRAVDALESNGPRLRDTFQSFLRELRPEDLQGSQGTYQLRQEIQRRVNLVIAPAQVESVLIQQMLIQ